MMSLYNYNSKNNNINQFKCLFTTKEVKCKREKVEGNEGKVREKENNKNKKV